MRTRTKLRSWSQELGSLVVKGKSKTGMLAVAGLMLSMALPLPSWGQHHNQAPAPPRAQRQERPARESARPAREFRQRAESAPRSYAKPRIQEPSLGYMREPAHARPHPPSQGQPRSFGSVPSYGLAQQRDVPRPPARGTSPGAGFAQEQRREVAHPPSQPQSHPQSQGSGYGQGQPREVPRPPQAGSQQAREVPRPPGAGPQHHGGDWLRTHRELPLQEQQKALQSDPQFRKLPPQQQQRLENRLQNFNSLPPQEQQRRLNRIETWEHLTPQQKTQARQLASQWQQLAPQRRQMMKTAIGDLRAMPPEQRERVLDSPRFKSMFSEQERGMLRDTTKLPLAPAQPPAGPRE
jgi:hypothetical protein